MECSSPRPETVLDPLAYVASTIVIRPASLGDVQAILDLHSKIFSDKFIGVFGSRGMARGLQAMATLWQQQGPTSLQGMVVAEWQHQIIGTVSLRTATSESSPVTMEMVFPEVLGWWGTVRSIFALSLLSHQVRPEEGFVTDVAVMEQFRRRGIARSLLLYIEKQAYLQRKHYLGLYVSGANWGAQQLYAISGFTPVRVRRSWLMHLVFGQRDWIYMRKDLLPPRP